MIFPGVISSCFKKFLMRSIAVGRAMVVPPSGFGMNPHIIVVDGHADDNDERHEINKHQ